MNKPTTKLILLGLATCLAGGSAATNRGQVYVFHHENVLGTSLELKVSAATKAEAERAESAALKELDREAAILSAYDPSSEFSRWMQTRNRPVKVSRELLDVLGEFDQWRRRTSGALDASAEVVSRAWKKAASENRTPTDSEMASAVRTIKQQHWSVDRAAGTATHISDAPLALNSFTKSYILQQAAEAAMRSVRVNSVVMNVGGDIVVRGTAETVRIADPKSDAENSEPIDRVLIDGRAIATSGNYRRGFDIAGRHYSHIVDPRTGAPVDHIISSTVVARDAVEAGALATAFSVMQAEETRKLAASLPGVDYLLIHKDGTRVASPGWKAIQVASIGKLPIGALPMMMAAGGNWDTTMELNIAIELAQATGGRVKRPYLAVWIEDKDKFPVKTVALWFNEYRWLSEMKAWFRSDRLRKLAEGNEIYDSVSSATRPAGKYNLKWDGRDNQRQLVKAGTYTVWIEAAREHGGYSLYHQEFDFNGSPKKADLPASAEVNGAILDYRKY
jgi:thiamine biosynthesis lipoprotein ApbE